MKLVSNYIGQKYMAKRIEHLEDYLKSLSKSVQDLTTRVEMLERESREKKK